MNQLNNTATLLNKAEVQTLIAQAAPQDNWEVLPYEAPILPVSAALLHTGQILFFGGSGNFRDNHSDADILKVGSALWNLNDGTFTRPTVPVSDAGDGDIIDVFCNGLSFLADGRLLVAGSTLSYADDAGGNFEGGLDTLVFEPMSQQWTKLQLMNSGRWYPTLVTLGDGRVLAVSGRDENGNLNQVPEVYAPNQNVWSAFAQSADIYPTYPHLFLLRDGRVFFSGGNMGGNGITPRLLTLPTSPGQQIAEQEVSGLVEADYGNQAASVLLPPAQDQRVMLIGGGSGDEPSRATNRVNIVDLKADNPTYISAASLNFARIHVSAVLLPDRTVFVCGGSQMAESADLATLAAEIYNPATDTWTVVATATVARMYHSVALLLPDGRVAVAGGNPDHNVNELRLEMYSPAYLSLGTRPQIQSAPQSLTYGQTIQIQTEQAEQIQWVSLIKPTANTHSCDTGQRLVDLEINAAGNVLTATVTNEPNLAPPGWYMLFIVDQNGVPSIASWTQLLPAA